MKIFVDQEQVLDVTDNMKAVIKHDIPEDVFDADMKRRVRYIIEHKYEQCFDEFKKYGEQLLRDNGVAMIPTDRDAFIQLVISQPNYKDRIARDAETPKGV
jgi:hypothetical protein